LSFRGIRILTHAAGEATQLHIGMLGTMAQLYLSELRDKTRRGLMGRMLAGRSAGGNTLCPLMLQGRPAMAQSVSRSQLHAMTGFRSGKWLPGVAVAIATGLMRATADSNKNGRPYR
jgi:DNA invertase Pin-like site-specific DNA recombinase